MPYQEIEQKTKHIEYRHLEFCPLCKNTIRKKYTELKDRLNTTQKTFAIYECIDCGTAILNPMPFGDFSSFYPTNYLSSEAVEKKEVNKNKLDLEKWYRYDQYIHDFRLFKISTGLEINEIASYLDIGCGSGERVMFVNEKGCKNSFGIDKFNYAKKVTQREGQIINSEILEFNPKDKFQVVSLYHVLEHLDNPMEVLLHIKKNILAENGYLLIQVPNYDSFERYLFKKNWFCFDAPRHLWHFNEKSLAKILSASGYHTESSHASNALLHPVSIVSSIFPLVDIQRIWVDRVHGTRYKTLMKLIWASLTIATIPINIIQNIFKKASMLTITASNKLP